MTTSQVSRRRRPPFPWFGRTQLWVTLALAGIVLGSFLPWWQTFIGPQWGLDTYGMWTMWAAAMGLAGALSVRRSLYEILPAIAGPIALGVVLWVTADGISTCQPAGDGSSPCRPGVGLVITGAAALNTTILMIRYHLSEKRTASNPADR